MEMDECIPEGGEPSALGRSIIANDQLQKYFEKLLERIEGALQDNLQHQDELETALKTAKEGLHNRRRFKKINLGCFSSPFFQDFNGVAPDPNEDVLKQKRLDDVNPMLCHPGTLWTAEEVKNLNRGVQAAAVESVATPIQQERNRLKKALSLRSMSDADRQEHKKSLDRLMDELQQIKSQTYTDYIPTEQEWEIIQRSFVSSRTVADCKHYMAIKDCSQEGKMKSAEDDWTLEEDKMLHDLADRYAEPNWVSVAEKLGTNRMPFHCLARWEKLQQEKQINVNLFWTDEETLRLVKAVEIFGSSRWRAVSDYMGDKTSHQCNNRWGCIGGEAGLDTGRWSLEEDKKLLHGVRLYGSTGKWNSIGKLLERRSHAQCKARYTTCFSKPFSPDEDRMILEHVAEYGDVLPHDLRTLAALIGRRESAVFARWRLLDEEAARRVDREMMLHDQEVAESTVKALREKTVDSRMRVTELDQSRPLAQRKCIRRNNGSCGYVYYRNPTGATQDPEEALARRRKYQIPGDEDPPGEPGPQNASSSTNNKLGRDSDEEYGAARKRGEVSRPTRLTTNRQLVLAYKQASAGQPGHGDYGSLLKSTLGDNAPVLSKEALLKGQVVVPAEQVIATTLQKTLYNKTRGVFKVNRLPKNLNCLPPSTATVSGLRRLFSARSALMLPTTERNVQRTRRAFEEAERSSNTSKENERRPASGSEGNTADGGDDLQQPAPISSVMPYLPENSAEFQLLKRRFSNVFLLANLLRIVPLPARNSVRPEAAGKSFSTTSATANATVSPPSTCDASTMPPSNDDGSTSDDTTALLSPYNTTAADVDDGVVSGESAPATS